MGGFAAAAGSPFAVGANPQSVAVADFNGDGNVDLVTANFGDGTVTVLLGNGSGSFTPAAGSPYGVGTNPQSVAVGDFNGDGNPDIVTANNGANTLTVLLGDGTGGFAAAPGSPLPVGLFPQSVAVGDFNNDGNPDLVEANSGNNTVRVLLGNGMGGSRAPGLSRSDRSLTLWPSPISTGMANRISSRQITAVTMSQCFSATEQAVFRGGRQPLRRGFKSHIRRSDRYQRRWHTGCYCGKFGE